jgi:transcriptional regulator with XRE-family HTH domain
MSGHRKWSEIRGPLPPEQAAALAQERRLSAVLEGLYRLREARGVSQEELARAWDTSQPNVSKIERQHDLLFSTITRYVESLGGEVCLLAVFPDQDIEIRLDGPAIQPRDNVPDADLAAARHPKRR